MSKQNFLISTDTSALSITWEQAKCLFCSLGEHFGWPAKKQKHKKPKRK
jgi:hypothetical protein